MASRRTPESKSSRTKSAAPAEPVTVPPEVTAGTPAETPQPGKAAPRTKRTTASSRPVITPDMRRGMIAEAAYLRAERRGFVPGYEEEDWLAAEAEVDKLLSADRRVPQ